MHIQISNGTEYEYFLNDDLFYILDISILVALNMFLSLVGIGTNALNMVVFYRQGVMTHSCTLCLFMLSVSDWVYSVLNLWGSAMRYLSWHGDTLSYPFNVLELYMYISMRPQNMLLGFSGCITGYLTFERCFSVTFPFKVKVIFTPKRSLAVLCLCFIVVFLMDSPLMFWKLPATVTNSDNITVLCFCRATNFPPAWYLINGLGPFVLRLVIVAIVLLCNCLIVYKVFHSKRFRNVSSGNPRSARSIDSKLSVAGENQTVCKEGTDTAVSNRTTTVTTTMTSSREMRLVRMVLVLSFVFFICYSFDRAVRITFFFVLLNHHIKQFFLLYSLTVTVQMISTITNICIYYTMSTSYKDIVKTLLCISK